MAVQHYIHQLVAEVHQPASLDTHSLGDRFSELIKHEITEQLTAICDAVDATDTMHTIDQLEIDLGTIRHSHIEEDVHARIQNQLPAIIRELKDKLAQTQDSLTSEASSRSIPVYEQFFISGTLPANKEQWTAAKLKAVFVDALQADKTLFTAVLRRYNNDVNAFNRLMGLFTFSEWKEYMLQIPVTVPAQKLLTQIVQFWHQQHKLVPHNDAKAVKLWLELTQMLLQQQLQFSPENGADFLDRIAHFYPIKTTTLDTFRASIPATLRSQKQTEQQHEDAALPAAIHQVIRHLQAEVEALISTHNHAPSPDHLVQMIIAKVLGDEKQKALIQWQQLAAAFPLLLVSAYYEKVLQPALVAYADESPDTEPDTAEKDKVTLFAALRNIPKKTMEQAASSAPSAFTSEQIKTTAKKLQKYADQMREFLKDSTKASPELQANLKAVLNTLLSDLLPILKQWQPDADNNSMQHHLNAFRKKLAFFIKPASHAKKTTPSSSKTKKEAEHLPTPDINDLETGSDTTTVTTNADAHPSKSSAETSTSKTKADTNTQKTRTDAELMENLQLEDGFILPNCGLVMLWPFFTTLFKRLDWTAEADFKSEEHRMKAVHALHFIASGETAFFEPDLVLIKVLCGMPLATHVQPEFALTDEEREECQKLPLTLKSYNEKFQNTSVDGIRANFLMRTGKLTTENGSWKLVVEKQPFDVLLEALPWTYNIIKFHWMPFPVLIEW